MKKTVKKAKRQPAAIRRLHKSITVMNLDNSVPSDIYNAVAKALGEKLIEVNSPKLPNPFDKI